jgi:hypothetical protein
MFCHLGRDQQGFMQGWRMDVALPSRLQHIQEPWELYSVRQTEGSNQGHQALKAYYEDWKGPELLWLLPGFFI